jgi:hypothetical protein
VATLEIGDVLLAHTCMLGDVALAEPEPQPKGPESATDADGIHAATS